MGAGQKEELVLTDTDRDAPDDLTEDQRAVWSETLATLRRNGVGRVNWVLLELYARALIRLRTAEAHVSEFGVLVPHPRTGIPIENPHLSIAQKTSAEVAKLSKAIGLERELTKAEPETKKLRNGRPMSVAAYARHRGLSTEAIRKAIKVGRLNHSIVMVGGKPKIGDLELADKEWTANTSRPLTPPADAVDIQAARRAAELAKVRKAQASARLAELELEEKEGKLIDAEQARSDVEDLLVGVKTRLLGVPSKCKQRKPAFTAEDVAIIDAAIREALEELAGHGVG